MPTPKELARGLLNFDREKEMLRQLPGLLNMGYEAWKAQPQMAAFGGLLSGDVEPMKEWLGVGQPWPKDAAAQVKSGAYNLAMDWNNPMGMAGTFIGKGAKTWDAVKASEAEKLLASGADPRNVWKNTGTFKGVDGHLRQEIPDNEMTQAIPLSGWVDRKNGQFQAPNLSAAWDTASSTLTPEAPVRAMRLFKHDELAKSYPYGFTKNPDKQSIMDVPVQVLDDSATSGAWDDGTLVLNGSLLPQPAKSTALHELQHAIQEREGWASGGNPQEMQSLLLAQKQAEAEKLWPIYSQLEESYKRGDTSVLPQMQALEKQINQIYDAPENGFNAYQRLAGEAEARLTQSRMNMSMPERLNSYPYDMLDVPQDQLIIRGLLGGM